jgi:hypothetical protein
MSHVFVRLSGNGLRLVPYWPYRFSRDGQAVKVACWAAPDVKEVTVDGASVEGIVDVGKGPEGDWRIETTAFSCAWPQDFTIEAPTDPGDTIRFYLFGPGEELIYPQGPTSTSRKPAEWAAPGQRFTSVSDVNGIQVVALSYRHNGVPWRQSHWLIPWANGRTLVITAQSPTAQADRTKAAARMVATSIQRWRDETR